MHKQKHMKAHSHRWNIQAHHHTKTTTVPTLAKGTVMITIMSTGATATDRGIDLGS